MEKILEKEDEGNKKIETLTRDLNRVKETRAEEVGKRKKKLAFLKNELQELKAKTRMEDSFLMKCTITDSKWE